MELVALPALTDNYIWMIHNGQQALVVDPGDATVVIAALQSQHLQLAAVFITHRHADHTHGLMALHHWHHQRQGKQHSKESQNMAALAVYGPSKSEIAGVTHKVQEGDALAVLGLDWLVWDTPGHTADHIVYMTKDAKKTSAHLPCTGQLVFCADTLFSAGCGRIFDGNADDFAASLRRLSELPLDTCLCPTHEYTASNLQFAAAVEPDNPDIATAIEWADAQRSQGLATLPTTVAHEKLINPFIRTQHPAVIAQALAHGADNDSHPSVFKALRRWKDHFQS
jgi:hydroxyacylglutathione hydrolase